MATAALIAVVTGCGSPDEARIGRDCQALIEAARRASACDPQLQTAAELLAEQPDEPSCRIAVRSMLDASAPAPPSLRSVHAPPPGPDAGPLTTPEIERLRQLPQPATLVLVPDVPPGPGVVRTRATVGGLELSGDEQGRLSTTIRPGARTLELSHGGRTRTYCVELRGCETLTVTAHGARLARHPDVRTGGC